MSKNLVAVACAFDGLLTLLFTQAGMFFIGKGHADVTHGIAPKQLAFGLYGGNIALLALILAVSMALHGLWCWRKYRTLGPQEMFRPLEKIVIVAVPLIGIVIGGALATVLAKM